MVSESVDPIFFSVTLRSHAALSSPPRQRRPFASARFAVLKPQSIICPCTLYPFISERDSLSIQDSANTVHGSTHQPLWANSSTHMPSLLPLTLTPDDNFTSTAQGALSTDQADIDKPTKRAQTELGMTDISEIPYQAQKHVRFDRPENTDIDYFTRPTVTDNDQEMENGFTPKGLVRIREDNPSDADDPQSKPQHPSQIAKFSTESLHSFSFSSTNDPDMMEARVSIITRSIDFMKQKIKGWKVPDAAFQYLPQSPTNTMTVMEKYGWPTSWSTANTPRSSMDLTEEPEDHLQQHERASTNESEASDSTMSTEDSSRSSRSSTPTTAGSVKPPSPRPARRKNAKLKRTLTDIPKINNSGSYGLSGLPRRDEFLSQHPAPLGRSMHSPTRFLPQNQAMLTSNAAWQVSLVNDIACLVFGYERRDLMGMSTLELIASPFRERHEELMRKRKEELAEGGGRAGGRAEDDERGVVLVCGKVIPIIKKDNTTSAASLWLKEKKDDSGNPIYIWIFEEIAESLVSVHVNQSGVIRDIDGSVEELYGYATNELIGRSIDVMIPAWAKLRVGDSGYCELNTDEETLRIPDERLLNIAEINRVKFFGSKTKFGACFPVITKVSGPSTVTTAGTVEGSFIVKIISIPTIAGLVTIRKDGMIQSCNAVFAKYLFGFMPEDLIEVKKIGELLPNFPLILEEVISERTLQVGSIINNTLCRKALRSALANITAGKRPLPDGFRMTNLDNAKKAEEGHPPPALLLRRVSTDVSGPLPSIVAIHRDTTEFDVQVQMRIVESAEENLYALWIIFDRVATFIRVGHPVSLDSGLRSVPQTPKGGHFPNPSASYSTPSSRSSMSFDDDSLAAARMSADSKSSPSSTSNVILHPPTPAVPFGIPQTEARPSETKPIMIPTDPKAMNIPKNIIPVTPPATATPPEDLRSYSALTNSKRIEDYEVVNSLGQGAYGLVKLAYHKQDPFKKKVVLKYVVKSRILVDCWTRDRHLGLIPLEIHILHTLRRIPHRSIVNMTDYFEDDEHYYVEMDLHGAGMDLFDYIELNNNINERELKTIFRQVVEAVQHLHVNKIVHRDIKDENVILDENGTVQLIDFGSAAYLREGKKYDTFCGTLDYAAPEVLQGKKYDGPPQDIWALGILLYTLIYKENPFYNIDEILARELRIPFVLCEDLIKRMLNRDIEKRPTIDEVLSHPWFYDET